MKVNKIVILLSMMLTAVFGIGAILLSEYREEGLSLVVVVEVITFVAFALQLHLLLNLDSKLKGSDLLDKSYAEDKQRKLVYSRISTVVILLIAVVYGWQKTDSSIARILIEVAILFLFLLISTLKIRTEKVSKKYKKVNSKIKTKKNDI